MCIVPISPDQVFVTGMLHKGVRITRTYKINMNSGELTQVSDSPRAIVEPSCGATDYLESFSVIVYSKLM